MSTHIGSIDTSQSASLVDPWASTYGRGTAETVTLDAAFADYATDAVDGWLPAGYPIGKITAGGAAKYDAAESDGTETLAGLTVYPVPVPDAPSSGARLFTVAIQAIGDIVVARLPEAIAAPGRADLPLMNFRE